MCIQDFLNFACSCVITGRLHPCNSWNGCPGLTPRDVPIKRSYQAHLCASNFCNGGSTADWSGELKVNAFCPYHVPIEEANDAKHAAATAEFKAREARRVAVGLRRVAVGLRVAEGKVAGLEGGGCAGGEQVREEPLKEEADAKEETERVRDEKEGWARVKGRGGKGGKRIGR